MFRAREKIGRDVDTMLAATARCEATPPAMGIVDRRRRCLRKVGCSRDEISWAYGIEGYYGLQSQKLLNRGCTWDLTLGGAIKSHSVLEYCEVVGG